MAKLTKAFIDKVKPPQSSYEIHWDAGDGAVKGYGLRVTATGKRVFVAQGRVKGKAVIFTIGPFGEWTESEARESARKILQRMRDGIDPRDAKKQDEAASVTLREVADAYFDRPGRLKDSTKAEMNRHVEKVFGAWQERPIASITEDDVRKRFREMAEHGLRGTPAPGQAQISMVTLRTLINYAAGRYKLADGSSLIKHNPVKALKDEWQGFKPRTRDVAEDKVGAVWHMLSEARLNPKNGDALAGIDLVRFLLLTGTRRMEGAALTWDRVHIDEDPVKCWFHLPDPKNDNPVWLPLSSQAVELLQARDRIAGNPFVFPSRSKVGHILDTRSPLEIISKAAGLHLSCHDLRRTFVSIGVATLDIDLYKMELLTNHVPKGITARHYLRTSRLQYLQTEVQKIGDWIQEQGRIAAAVAAGDNVVPIRA
jgi:integrase